MKMLGNGRIEAQCFDGEKRLAHIRGKMRKKVGRPHPFSCWSTNLTGCISLQVWINQGDIILVSLRDFQDDKADVIQKYTVSVAHCLALCCSITNGWLTAMFFSTQPEEARNLKSYGELPASTNIVENEGTNPEGEGDDIDFDDEGDDEVDIDNI